MIKEFRNEYAFLSNFFACPIKWKGHDYNSVEHAYQSEKSIDPEWKKFCQEERFPGKVKKESEKIKKRPDFHKENFDIMENLLRQKFMFSEFKNKLLETGDDEIQEGNRWGDKFWGVDLDTGEGENHLGKLIMKIREDIKNGRGKTSF